MALTYRVLRTSLLLAVGAFIVAIAVGLITRTASAAAEVGESGIELGATARIDGESVPIGLGSVVARGELKGEQCAFSPVLSVSAPAGVEVAVSVDGDCTAVVTELKVESEPADPPKDVSSDESPKTETPGSAPSAPVALSAVTHEMWAKNTVQEQFGITSFGRVRQRGVSPQRHP